MGVNQDGRRRRGSDLAVAQTAHLLAGLSYGRRIRHRLAAVVGALAVWLGAGFAVTAVVPAAPGWVPPLALSVAVYLGGTAIAGWGLGAGDRRRVARWIPTLVVASVVLLLLLAGLAAIPRGSDGGRSRPGSRRRRRSSSSGSRPRQVIPSAALALLPGPEAVATILNGPIVDVDCELAPSRGVLAAEWTASADGRIDAVVRDQAKVAARVRGGSVPSHGRRRWELDGMADRGFVEVRTSGESRVAMVAVAAVRTWVVMIRVWGPAPPADAAEVLTASLRSMVEALTAALEQMPGPPPW